jgi:poly(glycerol-phosphate) alpha-glucosyltransferase
MSIVQNGSGAADYTSTMRICYVSQSASRAGYGLFPIVVGTTKELARLGHAVEVAAVRDAYTSLDGGVWGDVRVTTFEPRGPQNLFFAPAAHGWARKQRERFDIVALQGVWSALNAIVAHDVRAPRTRIVLTPQGMLDSWAIARSRLKKRLAGLIYVNRMLRNVDCFHVNSEQEAAAVRRLGYRAPIAIIPNGVELPVLEATAPPAIRTLLFLGRLHAKKGVRELLAAWSGLRNESNDWKLVLAGPDEMGLRSELEAAAAGGLNLEYAGAVFGKDKDRLLRSASAFVLPSFSEGFPMSVLEAWSYGLPVIMTPQCNIDAGFQADAAISTEPTANALTTALRRLLASSPHELESMGRRGRALVERQYSWARVAQQLEDVYDWLLARRARPDTVYLD